MVHIVIDRRKNDKGKSTDNRRRFVRRVKEQIRDAVKDVIKNGSIKEIISNKGKTISIPGKGLSKPMFHHSTTGGTRDRTLAGNKNYNAGDRIARPEGGGASSRRRKADKEGKHQDAFTFSLTREEFLELFFEDLELPDMVKNQIIKLDEYVMKRAGFSVDGPPSRLNIVRSIKLAKGRRFALRTPKKKLIKSLETTLEELKAHGDPSSEDDRKKIADMEDEIFNLKKQIRAIPFLDDIDLRYNHWSRHPNPTSQAVMFGIMDVSGSMDEWKKEMAKRFFMMMLLFLSYNYDQIDIVWIRHHSEADEVDEETFFYSGESGGTMVSPALTLMREIIDKRYPPHLWNIYACQATDGDNWPEDTPEAVDTLTKDILPIVRYFAYIEINQDKDESSDLWEPYAELTTQYKNMVMAVIDNITSIYPVFRSLFEKKK